MTTETESGLPPQAEPAEQGASTVEQQASTDTTTEQTQEQHTEEQQEQKREPWFQKRIGELTRARYEAQREAEAARREAEQVRAYIAQIQQGQQPQEAGEQRQLTQAEIDRLADERASQKLAEQRFNEQCNKVYEQGAKEFQDFDAAVRNLQLVGANRDFIELATSSDAGAKLLHHLGTDLDEAARILSLPPVQMARELTKLEFKLTQAPPPKPVSKAPAPISPIGTARVDDTGVRDDLPIDEWMRREQARTRRK